MFQAENRLAIDIMKEDSEETRPYDIYLTPENLARTSNEALEECK